MLVMVATVSKQMLLEEAATEPRQVLRSRGIVAFACTWARVGQQMQMMFGRMDTELRLGQRNMSL